MTDEKDRLPPPLMTSEPGSFARKTIVERKPQIIERVIADNPYPREIVTALEAFRDEIANELVQPLHEERGGAAFWNAQWANYADCTWLELPWFFAETYFYRRLLEATRYFQPGRWYRKDPFAPQKRAQEANAVGELEEAMPQILEVPAAERFVPLLHAALWGNRADLSNFTVAQGKVGDTTAEAANILIDDTAEVRELVAQGLGEVAFISDNVGADSLFDLVLADYLLTEGWAHRVTFHLKNQPFFVSDAMPQDIRRTIIRMRTSNDAGVASTAARLNRALIAGQLTLTTHPFWTRCLGFRDMPGMLVGQLEAADLVILKGDVNYRRLLDDRHWPHTTDLEEITDDFPRPFVVLRTLKGEILVGLEPGQAEALAAEEEDWLINGQRGLVQLVK